MKNANNILSSVASETFKKQRILVVDDDKVLRFYARTVLESSGLDVTIAKCGDEALAHLEITRFDLVLLDVNLPGMNGYEICRKIRCQYSSDQLPIVMVTGMDDLKSIEQAFQAGATDFAEKPVNWQILKNRISYILKASGISNNIKGYEVERKSLIDTIPDSILWLDDQGYITNLKVAAESKKILKGILKPGLKFVDILTGDSVEKIQSLLSTIQNASGVKESEFELMHEGHVHQYEVRIVKSESGGLMAILRDVTERNRAEEHIRYIAEYDVLTGLPNRDLIKNKLMEVTTQASISGGIVAMMRIQIADMEHITNVLGVNGRDDLFRLWANRAVDCISSFKCEDIENINAQAGRVNETGLAVIFSGLDDRSQLDQIIQELESCINDTFIVNDYEIKVACRVGVSLYPNDDLDGQQLLDKADLAIEELRKADSTGIGFYSEKTRESTLGRIDMLYDLRRSIENNDLHLEYQPKVDAKSGQLVGLEALARWNCPSRGSVSPAVFIPLAEEGGFMLELGEFVMYEACRQSQEWNKAGYRKMPVAINFSGHQFNQHGLVANILKTLEKYSIGNEQIEVELTESVAVNNEYHVKKILQELRELGIRTAIDDFGTGYSSLSSLRNFSFSILKIDRSFIQHINNNQNAASIAEAIINMGHALGLEVVAEGVEEESQLIYLRDKKCDVIQGYLTGKPTSGMEIERVLLSA